MAKLEAYDKSLDYSYAPGIFPATECLKNAPKRCLRLLLSSASEKSEGAQKLRAQAEEMNVRVEIADRALERISKKENCFAAMVYKKQEGVFDADAPHIVLVNPSDSGNLGTILRTALGFGVEDVALIRPCVDVFDPRVVRASMGSMFQLRIHTYSTFAEYQADHHGHMLYPFMLDGSKSLPDVLAGDVPARWTLVFGNEGSGLPAEFAHLGQPVRIPSNERIDSLNLSIAAAIGIYGFTRK